jgi:quercetin dioxygenase-like cupin family protein
MNQEYLDELAALNALGALDGEDLAEFKRAAGRGDRDLTELIAAYGRVADFISVSQKASAVPNPIVKEKVMRRVRESLAKELSREGPGEQTKSTEKNFLNVFASEGEWLKHPVPGVEVKQLSLNQERGYATLLMRVAAGTHYPQHHHSGPEECYVLQGDVHVGSHVFGPGDFHHADAGSDHGELFTESGCTLLLVVAASDYLPS